MRVVGMLDEESGVEVTETRTMGVSAVMAAVKRISGDLAMLPLPLYQRVGSDGRSRRLATEHPLYRLLTVAPNPEQDAFQFKEMMQASLLIRGNAYAEIERDSLGRPAGLWWLPANKVQLVSLRNEPIRYKVTLSDGDHWVDKQNMFHIKGFGLDGLLGLDPIVQHRQVFGLIAAIERYGSGFFLRGGTPSGILERPIEAPGLSEAAEDKVLEKFEGRYAGLDNAHRIWMLQEGMQWKQMGVSPQDAQALECRKFAVTEVARIFGIPPHLLADLDRATFSNIEQQSIEYVVYGIGPWAARWESRIAVDLLSRTEQTTFYPKFKVAALLRGDIAARYEAYTKLFNLGALSADDIRELEEMNPIPGGLGSHYFVQLNMVPVEQAIGGSKRANAADSAGGTGGNGRAKTIEHTEAWRAAAKYLKDERGQDLGKRKAARRLKLRDAWRSRVADRTSAIVEWEVREIRNALVRFGLVERNEARSVVAKGAKAKRRHGHDCMCGCQKNRFEFEGDEPSEAGYEKRSEADFNAFLKEFYAAYPDRVVEELGPVLRGYLHDVAAIAADEVNGVWPDIESQLWDWVGAFAGGRAKGTRLSLEETLRNTPGDLVGLAMSDRMDDWEENKGDYLANRALVEGGDVASLLIWTLSGVELLRWIANGSNACPMCEGMDGAIAEINKSFVRKGETVGEGEDSMEVQKDILHAPLHGGCECTIGPG